MRDRPLCSVCLIFAFLICITVWAGKEKVIEKLNPSPLKQTVKEWETVTLEGQVYRKEIKERYQVLYLRNNSIFYQQQSLTEPKVILYEEEKKEVHIGDKVRAAGTVSFYRGARNPGNFDQKLYYQRQGIYGSIWASRVEVTEPDTLRVWEGLYTFRQRWREVLCEAAGEKDGAILAAMILGDKTGMDEETKELYQANGIGHIIAISGLHLSFLGIGIYQVMRRISGSYTAGGIAGIGFLMLYVMMIGVTVSAARAFVMFLFRVGADMTGRHYDSLTAWAAALSAVLVWRPLSIYDGGFWMSFLAVAAVIMVLPLFEGMRFQGFFASVSINLVLLPVLLCCFYEFPLYSVVLNLLVIPLMSVILWLAAAGSLAAGVGAVLGGGIPVGIWMLKLCRAILWLYERSCEIMLALPGARIVTGKPQGWQIVLYYICLIAVLVWQYRIRGRQKKETGKERSGGRTLLCAVVLLFGTALLLHRFEAAAGLEITVLDVGQGDGIFLRGPTGGTYLIDGGSSDVKEAGRYRIEPYLLSQGVARIDYVFVSHGDDDHVNGIEQLLRRRKTGVEIGMLILPEKSVWDERLSDLALCAAECGVQTAVIEQGQTVREGALEILCVQPSRAYQGETGNAASMVLAVRYGKFDMLFTGDVEGTGEEELTENIRRWCGERRFEVLKAAHHGSKNSSSEEFLDMLMPSYTVISAGIDNRYGHPHEETMDRLRSRGSKTYCTSECGAVSLLVTEENVEISRYVNRE